MIGEIEIFDNVKKKKLFFFFYIEKKIKRLIDNITPKQENPALFIIVRNRNFLIYWMNFLRLNQ